MYQLSSLESVVLQVAPVLLVGQHVNIRSELLQLMLRLSY